MKLFSSLKNTAQSYLDQYKQKDPATYAAAQQAVGGILILDGFIGIDNPLGRNRRPGLLASLTGIAGGILFIFVSTFINSISGMDKMTATTTATVVSVASPSASSNSSSSGTCGLTAKYTVAGVEYTGGSSDGSSTNCTKAAGETLTIYYNPANPKVWSADTKTLGLFLSIFSWGGAVLVITSFVTFIIRLLSIIFGWKILKSGRALAKTLPQGANLGTVIEEIKQHFKTAVFGSAVATPQLFGQPSTMQAPAATPAAPWPVAPPVEVVPTPDTPAATEPPAAPPTPSVNEEPPLNPPTTPPQSY